MHTPNAKTYSSKDQGEGGERNRHEVVGIADAFITAVGKPDRIDALLDNFALVEAPTFRWNAAPVL